MRAPPFLTNVTASQVHRGLLYKIGWATIAHAGAADQHQIEGAISPRAGLYGGWLSCHCMGRTPPLFDIHVDIVSASIVGFYGSLIKGPWEFFDRSGVGGALSGSPTISSSTAMCNTCFRHTFDSTPTLNTQTYMKTSVKAMSVQCSDQTIFHKYHI